MVVLWDGPIPASVESLDGFAAWMILSSDLSLLALLPFLSSSRDSTEFRNVSDRRSSMEFALTTIED